MFKGNHKPLNLLGVEEFEGKKEAKCRHSPNTAERAEAKFNVEIETATSSFTRRVCAGKCFLILNAHCSQLAFSIDYYVAPAFSAGSGQDSLPC